MSIQTRAVAVVTDAVYTRAGATVYSRDGVNGDAQWGRYKFDDVSLTVIGRLAKSSDHMIDSPLINHRFEGLPHQRGLWGSVFLIPRIFMAAWRLSRSYDLFILRLPGICGLVFALALLCRRRPYVVELVGDIHAVLRFSPRILVRSLAPLSKWLVRLVVNRAKAVRYVTKEYLQATYPTRGKSFSISNVQVSGDLYATRSRVTYGPFAELRLLCVGSHQYNYKGHDVAIRAVRMLKDAGVATRLTIVGSGVLTPFFQTLAEDLGVSPEVTFAGQLTKDDVFSAYRSHDVLLQPSLTEGLPRTVIEAMSQALPVVGTEVGGIPELLNTDYIVKPASAVELATAIVAISEPRTWNLESERSLKAAQAYNFELLAVEFQAWMAFVSDLA